MRRTTLTAAIAVFLTSLPLHAAEVSLNGHQFTIPDGFSLEVAAAQPLVDRPITASFDEQGRLYVADSSGSNDKVEQQLEERPHRIVRLEDGDGDGQFDKTVVFADRMMFPEGTLWHDGSLYVSAPPSIWKLTDTDHDGVADKREEWFQGQTLTGCANDLHGPYLGRDGWIYWCKGAFAEQTYERHGGSDWTTRAAHIFRRHPRGGPVEPVMTGGMDNPVDVVFTPSGERIFTTTFFQHPRGGQRDGLIHAIYGGVYGKVHGVIEGHPRTGGLMPPLVHFGAAAPSGLVHLESDQFGPDYKNNLFAALFNMRKVTRHVLRPTGASFETVDEDFVVAADTDFHPTDVVEDADGSLLIIDTGGWYKLCCPTSQLYKPDILGAIYRVKRTGSHGVVDERGKSLHWNRDDPLYFTGLLGDSRPQVRSRAQARLREIGAAAIEPLGVACRTADDAVVRRNSVWTLARIAGEDARTAVRSALSDTDHSVRQAAVHVAGLHRDRKAVPSLLELLASNSGQIRRAVAEALGRIGDSQTIPALLSTDAGSDRILDHSLTYALIEIDQIKAMREFLYDPDEMTQRRALIAADQMESGGLAVADIESLLNAAQEPLRDTAWWLVALHPEWAPQLAGYFARELAQDPTPHALQVLRSQLPALLHDEQLRSVVGMALNAKDANPSVVLAVVQGLASSSLKAWPAEWEAALERILVPGHMATVPATISALYSLPDTVPSAEIAKRLLKASQEPALHESVRLKSLALIARRGEPLDLPVIKIVSEYLPSHVTPSTRSLAVDILTSSPLNDEALMSIIRSIPSVGAMELSRLLPIFQRSKAEPIGLALVDALEQSPVASALPSELLTNCLQGFAGSVPVRREQMVARIEADSSDKLNQLEQVFSLLEHADIRRGQAIFNSSKASCRACHEMGYLGGEIGPDLTRIGRTRSERDLLEAILFPSISFVRSYEPVEIVTDSGRVFSGVVRDETNAEVVLAIDAQKVMRIRQEEIEERRQSSVSVMPAGLEKQLTRQELADLVKFLHAAR